MAGGTASPPWIEPVLRFWFDELKPAQWWRATPALDDQIRRRFGALRDALVGDPPPAAALDARGHVAAVLVFDQFPRHLFRGSAEAFATDALARATACDAIDRVLDRELDVPLRHFLYMPLMHGEDLATQRRSIALFQALRDGDALRSAREHHETIRRFGRFPARNAALGRMSTPEEQAFLASRTPRG